MVVGNSKSQSYYVELTKQWSTYSTEWCIRSICPSVYRWYAVDKAWSHPNTNINSCQKWDTKRGSRLEISLHGIPCFATTVAIKIYANSGVVICTVQGTKYVCLLNRSTKVAILSNPRSVLGKYVIRSSVTYSKTYSGTGNGYNKPYGT